MKYIQMRRKIIDDYRFILIIILIIYDCNIAIFWICMDATFFGMIRF